MDHLGFASAVLIAAPLFFICRYFYSMGHKHGNRYVSMLISNYKASAQYEVIAFCPHHDGKDHLMILKDLNSASGYPLAAIKGDDLAHRYSAGDIINANIK